VCSYPETNIRALPRKAPTVLVDGEMIAFAHTIRKLEMPYTWYIIPKRPTTHTKSAGICNILIAPANRAHHFSEPANGNEKSGRAGSA
jgi:hypothetical protein